MGIAMDTLLKTAKELASLIWVCSFAESPSKAVVSVLGKRTMSWPARHANLVQPASMKTRS